LTGSNPNPAKGYPIVSLTWILLNQQGNGVKLESIKKAFEFTLSDQAQAMAPQLGYVTLPADVLVKTRKALAAIR
jgi:phosphate transport system substrate-binding protein